MSSCSLKCLTLFSNSYSPKRVHSTHFPLCGYELAGDDWESKFFFNFNLSIRNLNYGFKKCRLAHDKTVFSKGVKNLLFYLEFVINDGVCMVFEGNTTPGRSSKNSLLSREFKHTDIRHQSVCTEGVAKVKKRDLTYDEKKLMNCEIEHDRMLFNGYDRQSASFQAIDKFGFLSIEPTGWKLKKTPMAV